ncbi:MAG: hypothetical protein ACLU3I_09895 [Acutalibacteraceae bacterium]
MRKEKTEHSARLPFAASMLIFGTIGLLRRFIDLPSGVIACFRGLLGCVLLLLLQRLGGKSRAWLPSGSLFCRCSFPAA